MPQRLHQCVDALHRIGRDNVRAPQHCGRLLLLWRADVVEVTLQPDYNLVRDFSAALHLGELLEIVDALLVANLEAHNQDTSMASVDWQNGIETLWVAGNVPDVHHVAT